MLPESVLRYGKGWLADTSNLGLDLLQYARTELIKNNQNPHFSKAIEMVSWGGGGGAGLSHAELKKESYYSKYDAGDNVQCQHKLVG